MRKDYISNTVKKVIGNLIIDEVVREHPLITQTQLRKVCSHLYRRLWHKTDRYFEVVKTRRIK